MRGCEDVLLLTPRNISQRRSHPVVTLSRQLAKAQDRIWGKKSRSGLHRVTVSEFIVFRLARHIGLTGHFGDNFFPGNQLHCY